MNYYGTRTRGSRGRGRGRIRGRGRRFAYGSRNVYTNTTVSRLRRKVKKLQNRPQQKKQPKAQNYYSNAFKDVQANEVVPYRFGRMMYMLPIEMISFLETYSNPLHTMYRSRIPDSNVHAKTINLFDWFRLESYTASLAINSAATGLFIYITYGPNTFCTGTISANTTQSTTLNNLQQLLDENEENKQLLTKQKNDNQKKKLNNKTVETRSVPGRHETKDDYEECEITRTMLTLEDLSILLSKTLKSGNSANFGDYANAAFQIVSIPVDSDGYFVSDYNGLYSVMTGNLANYENIFGSPPTSAPDASGTDFEAVRPVQFGFRVNPRTRIVTDSDSTIWNFTTGFVTPNEVQAVMDGTSTVPTLLQNAQRSKSFDNMQGASIRLDTFQKKRRLQELVNIGNDMLTGNSFYDTSGFIFPCIYAVATNLTIVNDTVIPLIFEFRGQFEATLKSNLPFSGTPSPVYLQFDAFMDQYLESKKASGDEDYTSTGQSFKSFVGTVMRTVGRTARTVANSQITQHLPENIGKVANAGLTIASLL